MKKPAVFFDRDGTLIDERRYLLDARRMHFYPSAVAGLRRLKKAGYKIVIVTNQSAVGRGHLTLRQLSEIHRHFRAFGRTIGTKTSSPTS